jgi:hypothetical protein
VIKGLCRVVVAGRSPDDSGSQSSNLFCGLGMDTGHIVGKRGENGARFRMRFGNDGGTARRPGRRDLLLRFVINVIQVC